MNNPLFPDVIVNGEPVPRAVIAAEAQNHIAPKNKPGLAWRKAASAVALKTLLLQESRNRKLDGTRRSVSPGKTETEDEALIRALLEDCIMPEVPTREEAYAEWRRDPSRFKAPCLWEASHILIACNPNDHAMRDAAFDRAREIAEQIVRRSEDFRVLAKNHSDCASQAANGSLGQISPGGTAPEFEAALHGLTIGEITKSPVLTRFGWHIIRVDAFLPGDVLPFEAVEQKILDAMQKAAWARAAKEFVAHLAASAEISGAKL